MFSALRTRMTVIGDLNYVESRGILRQYPNFCFEVLRKTTGNHTVIASFRAGNRIRNRGLTTRTSTSTFGLSVLIYMGVKHCLISWGNNRVDGALTTQWCRWQTVITVHHWQRLPFFLSDTRHLKERKCSIMLLKYFLWELETLRLLIWSEWLLPNTQT
jgi:hypothetical protein